MTKWIFIAFILLLGKAASSQDKSLLTYKIANIGQVKAGDTITAQITVSLLPGWYIYAPTEGNSLQDVQMMSIKFHAIPNELRSLGEVKMPEPRLHESHDVFMDDGNIFSQRFIVNASAAEGKYTVTAHLKYQACNSNICYPPITEKIGIDVNVAK